MRPNWVNKNPGFRVCSRCKEEKPETEFYTAVNHGRPSFSARCKPCSRLTESETRVARGRRPRTPPKPAREGYKFCTKCDVERPLSEFSPGRGYGGVRSQCKVCACAYSVERLIGLKGDVYKPRPKREISSEGTLVCTRCGIYKSTDQFFKISTKKTRLGLSSNCKQCTYERKKIDIEKHYAERKAQRDRYAATSRKRKIERDPVGYKCNQMLHSARTRARMLRVPFSITTEDILAVVPPGHICPILGTLLDFKVSGFHNGKSPSLDRIIPALGYVPGNIQIISHLGNTIKNCGTFEQLAKAGLWAQKQMALQKLAERKAA